MTEPFIPQLFGKAFEKIVNSYLNGIGVFLSPVFHIITFLIMLGIIFFGNKVRRIFSIYYLINYTWLFFYTGVYMFFLFYKEIGVWSFVFWGIVPVLLLIIIINLIIEIIKPKINLDLKNIQIWKFIVVPIIIFGFWYPTFIYGKGFIFTPKDLLFSAYGLMNCPTTMVILGILTLYYPKTNKGLFISLTIFSIMIGTAQVLLPYIPDIPLAIVGCYSLLLIIIFFIKNKFIISKIEK